MKKKIRRTIRGGPVFASLYILAACSGDGVQPFEVAQTARAVPAAFANASGTTTQTICTSPQTTELSVDGVTWGPAQPAGDLGAPYGAALPGSSWVGPYLNSGTLMATQPGTFWFRTTFELPVGAKNVSLAGAVHADNWATFALNGVEFFAQPGVVQYSAFQDPPDLFSTSKEFVEGLNVVKTTLVNAGGADNVPSSTALDFCYTVSYVAPTPADTTGTGGTTGSDGGKKGCPAAPSIAAHYLQDRGIQPGSLTGHNLVALVADHMTQGARFDGFDKCDEGYAAAVIAFVEVRLPH